MSAVECAAARRPAAPRAERRRSAPAPAARRAGRGWLGLRGRPAPLAPRRCACGASRTGCPTPTTPTRTRTSCPGAIGLFGHGWNPHYFVNPPAYTYLLHVVFAVWFGGRAGRARTPSRPTRPRSSSSRGSPPPWSGRSASGCCTCAGARLVDRRVGLLAAALLAVAFLPVFYSHLALNDVPDAGADRARAVGRRGRPAPRADARLRCSPGVGLGLACATKYTGGIVLAAAARAPPRRRAAAARRDALAAAAARARRRRRARRLRRRQPVRGARLRGLPRRARSHQSDGRRRRSSASSASTHDNGYRYYLWSFTWGLGWVAARRRRSRRARAARARRPPRWLAVLVPAPLLFVAFMGTQERFFGRWLLPRLPDRLPARGLRGRPRSPSWAGAPRARRCARRSPRSAPSLLLGQGVVYAAAQRARALARGHAQPDPRVAGRRNVPAADEDRRRAGRARRLGARHRAPVAADGQRRALGQVPDEPLERRQRRLVHPGRGADRQHRGLRAHAVPGPRRPLRARAATAGSSSARPSAAAPRPSPRTVPAGDRLLPRARAPQPTSPTRPRRTATGAGPVAVQLRLVLRLLPAGLPRPGPARCTVYAAEGRCRARV